MQNPKNIKIHLLVLSALISFAFNACKKDGYTPQIDLQYEVNVDGATVSFTVKTEGVTDYQWDFGDGQKSTEANPVHHYAGKGKYVPVLQALVNGKNAEAATVIRIAKTSAIKINDNSLDDWQTVTKDVVPLGKDKGVFESVKLDYDGNNVYLYVAMAGKKSDAAIFDFYIDADNNAGTGLLTNTFTSGGYDILLEGQLLKSGLDIFYHNSSDQTAFSFDQQSIADAYKVGTVKEENGMLKFEVSIARGKLKGLTGQGMRIGLQAIKNDWTQTLGSAPDVGTPSYFLDMSE